MAYNACKFPVNVERGMRGQCGRGCCILGQPLNSRNRRKSDRLRTVANFTRRSSPLTARKTSCQVVLRLRLWIARSRSSTRRSHRALSRCWRGCSVRKALSSWRLLQRSDRTYDRVASRPKALVEDEEAHPTNAKGARERLVFHWVHSKEEI